MIMCERILRSMFACGVVDDPPKKGVVDVAGGFEIAQKIEEQSIVLLKNESALLPLDAAKLHTIAVIGAHSDLGMISGGGSAQVDPPGGNAIMPPGKGATTWQAQIWFPTSPLTQSAPKYRELMFNTIRARMSLQPPLWRKLLMLPSCLPISGRVKGWTSTAFHFPAIKMI